MPDPDRRVPLARQAKPGRPGPRVSGRACRGAGGRRREERDRRKRPFWRDLVVIVVAALALTILLKAFVVQVFSIPSGSMENTLLPGDRVLVSKIVYRFRAIERGDIVVFSGQGPGTGRPAAAGQPVRSGSGTTLTNLVGDRRAGNRLRQARDRRSRRPRGLLRRAGPGHRQRRPAEREVLHLSRGPSPSQVPVQHHGAAGQALGDGRQPGGLRRLPLPRPTDPGGGTIPESAVVGRAFLIIWPLSRIGDLPIPATFQQAALHAAAAAARAVAGRRRRRPGRRRPRLAPPPDAGTGDDSREMGS